MSSVLDAETRDALIKSITDALEVLREDPRKCVMVGATSCGDARRMSGSVEPSPFGTVVGALWRMARAAKMDGDLDRARRLADAADLVAAASWDEGSR